MHRCQLKTRTSIFIKQSAHKRAEAGKTFLSHSANTLKWNIKKKKSGDKNF